MYGIGKLKNKDCVSDLKSKNKSTMFVGIDAILKNQYLVFGRAATSSKHVTQHYSNVQYQ